jgi:Peptidase family C25
VSRIVLYLGLISVALISANSNAAMSAKMPEPARLVIVVAAEAYRDGLVPWLERRKLQGFDVRMIDPESVLGALQSDGAVKRLRDEIARHLPGDIEDTEPDDSAPAAFVLLVGDAPGPRERLDSSRLIPAALQLEKSRPSLQKQFVSDNIFALPGSRGQSRLAVGRWPVRSADEVAVQVQKALNFEDQQTTGLHRRDVTFIATTPNYDPLLDPILEGMAMSMINGQIKPHWGLRAMYSSPTSSYFPGPVETRRQVIRWLEDATPVTLFAGHGYNRGVDVVRYEGKQFRVLDVDIANDLRGERPGTVLWMSACSCGDFCLPPPHRGLAEALVMNPHGPSAVVAGTDETSAYANLLLCFGLAQDVIEKRPATLGEAFLRFKRAAFKPSAPFLKNLLLSLEPTEKPELLPDDHQFLYNLLGDPTLSLNLPRKVPISAEVAERQSTESGQKVFSISGTLEDWDRGTARVSLLIDRIQMKKAVKSPASLDRDEDRRAAYFERFTMANDKVAAEAQVRVTGGHFSLELPIAENLVSKVRWLQVYVQSDGTPSQGWQDGVAAQPIRLIDEQSH